MNETRPTLAATTRDLLRNRSRHLSFRTIEKACGIDTDFLSRFQNDRIAHPSALHVQKLYEYLAGKPLEY